jgi:hypothetical protein
LFNKRRFQPSDIIAMIANACSLASKYYPVAHSPGYKAQLKTASEDAWPRMYVKNIQRWAGLDSPQKELIRKMKAQGLMNGPHL